MPTKVTLTQREDDYRLAFQRNKMPSPHVATDPNNQDMYQS